MNRRLQRAYFFFKNRRKSQRETSGVFGTDERIRLYKRKRQMRTKNMTQGRKVCGILNHISEDRATHGSVLSKQNNRSQLKFGGFIIRITTCTEWSRGRRHCHMCSTWLLLGEILSRRSEKNIVFKMTSKKGRMKLKARHTHVPE